MPKDDWAKARSRDAAKRAKARYAANPLSRAADQALDDWKAQRGRRPGTKKLTKAQKRRRKQAAKLKRQPVINQRIERKSAGLCPRCGSSDQTTRVETFKDHSMHVRLSCAKCGKFIKWQAHTELAKIE